MEGGEAAIGGLQALAALGVQIYLDDFGTGDSSLDPALAQCRCRGIKLDRGFVARASGDAGRRIIEAALSIGRARRLPRRRRGRRDRGSARPAARLGCRLVQGYLLGRPAPPEQIRASLGN